MVAKSDVANLRQQYASDGFVALPGFFDGQAVSELIANVTRFVQNVVPRLSANQVFFEDKHDRSSLKQIQHLDDHDAWFADLFNRPEIREIAEQLLAGPVVPKNMQYFNKPPGVGRPTPPHQDGYYFMLDPCEAVTMWLALDDVDEANGCVRYVRGSQKAGMREHRRTQTLGFSQGIVDYPTELDIRSEVAVAAQPGDLLVHDAMTIHRADGNRTTDRSRRALGFIFYSERAQEDHAAQAAYQRKLTAEMKAADKI